MEIAFLFNKISKFSSEFPYIVFFALSIMEYFH